MTTPTFKIMVEYSELSSICNTTKPKIAKRIYWTIVTIFSRILKCIFLISFSLFFDFTIPKVVYCPKPDTTDIPMKSTTPQKETVKSLSISARLPIPVSTICAGTTTRNIQNAILSMDYFMRGRLHLSCKVKSNS